MSKNTTLDLSGLKKLSKKLDNLSGEREVFMEDVLTDKFISSISKFDNLEAFMSACNIHTKEDFEKFSNDEMNKFVQSNTNFSSWQEMLNTAGVEYYKKLLDL